jgi:hypothetical protein
MNQKIHNWAFLIAGLLFISSCYESVEGCLDPSATNFNASADKDCCCEYPNLNLKTTWMYDTLAFNANSVYENGLGQLFSIKRLDILISEISPSFESTHFPLEDSLTLETFINEAVTIENNISYLSSNTATTSTGKFYSYGTIDQLQFRGGLQDQNINLFSLPNDHSLSNAGNLIQKNDFDSIYALFCVIHRDTIDSIANDTLTLPFYSNLGMADISCIIENDLGNNRIVPILVDLKKCFYQLDMQWNNQQMSAWLEDHVIEVFSCNPP